MSVRVKDKIIFLWKYFRITSFEQEFSWVCVGSLTGLLA